MARTADNRDWRDRIREGKQFDRETLSSWSRVYEGTRIQTDRGLGRNLGRRSGRPDIRFVVDEAADGAAMDAVLEVKDRDWDRMSADNAKRAVRRDRRQILRYIDGLVDGRRETGVSAAIVPALVYRRAPADEGLRRWAEDCVGEMGIAVLWEDGSPLDSEWFARSVRVAEAVLQPWADHTGMRFSIRCEPPQESRSQMALGPRGTAGVLAAAATSAGSGSARDTTPAAEEAGSEDSVWLPLGMRASDGSGLVLTVVRQPGPGVGPADLPAAAAAIRDELSEALAGERLLVIDET